MNQLLCALSVLRRRRLPQARRYTFSRLALIATLFMLSRSVRLETFEDMRFRLGRMFGYRYDNLESILFEELSRIDPFRSTYSFRGKEADYHRKYLLDAVKILDTIDQRAPTSVKEVRRIIYQELANNVFGNARGHVGKEGDYSGTAERVWAHMRG